MDVHKMKYLKENDVKVYNCTFQLNLIELRIFLRFPGKFFVEWKTANGNKMSKTQGFVENIDGKVNFNQKLILQVEMIYDGSKNTWIRKDSIINVYLVTKNRPDFNQLAGRINIDLSLACQNNPYKQPLTQSLTYTSTSADLKFSLDMKYSLQSKKSVTELDLMEFSDKLYLVKNNDNLSKSKSMDYLKNMQNMVSPVYQVNNSPKSKQMQTSCQTQVKPFHFPVSKLQSFGHEVKQVPNIDQQQFYPRMTLGKERKNISRQDYQLMIEEQSKGMKKSDLMVIPDMKKSRAEEEESEIHTQTSKKTQQEKLARHDEVFNETKMKKMGSQGKFESMNKQRSKSPESDIDIVVDLDSYCEESKEPMGTKRNYRQEKMKTSMNSSNSFSISRFKAQFQGSSSQDNFNKVKSPKQSITSLQMPSINGVEEPQSSKRLKQQCQAGKNRIKQLQNDISEVVKMLTDAREKIVKEQSEKSQLFNEIILLKEEKKLLEKKVSEFEQKIEYEAKINTINCEKLKQVSSQLTAQKSRVRSSSASNLSNDFFNHQNQISHLQEKLKAIERQKVTLESKLFKRDQIELQNEIKIQQLEEELVKLRTQKLDNTPNRQICDLGLKSNIKGAQVQKQGKQQEYIDFLQQKLELMEQQNINLKTRCSENIQTLEEYILRDQRMRQNVTVVEQEFQNVIKQLLQKQRIIRQKVNEAEAWKKKSYSQAYTVSAANEIKLKSIEEQLKKKDHMIQFCENQIHLLEQEIINLQKQNKELSQIHNKLLRQSFRYEGDLKVIKQENYRDSLTSSGQNFARHSPRLTIKEENALVWYKEAVQAFYTRNNIKETFEVDFMIEIHDMRKKTFDELQRSAKIINELLSNSEVLSLQAAEKVQEKEKANKMLEKKISELESRIDQLEQHQGLSAGSSNISPSKMSNMRRDQQYDQAEQLSQATKKRSPLNLSPQTKLIRQNEKLKSIIYDKNKEMSDLIASYQKLKLEKEKQTLLIKSKKVTLNILSPEKKEDEAELMHDILDLQIRLNKEKEQKHQIMEELELRKSLNRSQDISQYPQQPFDLSSVYKQIRALLASRQNFITTEQSLNKLAKKINILEQESQKFCKDDKLIYLVQEKSRCLSKELQVLKSTLLKMTAKDLQSFQVKTSFANILKPSQHSMNQLLKAIEDMVNTFV